MNSGRLRITEFKLENMVGYPAIVMIAKRNSGKSFVARDIMYSLRKKPAGVVIAPTDRLNSFYKFFFPDIYVHYDITPNIFAKILARQAIMIAKEEKKKKQGLKVDPSAVLVMDDCLSKKKAWSKDQNITEILLNGRHYKLTYILTMQTPLGLTPDLRLNFDFIFLLKEDSAINKKKLYENFASMFQTQSFFEQVFKSCTEDYTCMVIDNRKPSDNILEKVFWFKAKERKFTFGSQKFKDLHVKYYDKNHLVKRNQELINGAGVMNIKKRNDINIRVEKI